MRMFAKELVDSQPDAILASGTPVTAALQRETRTIPIVFVQAAESWTGRPPGFSPLRMRSIYDAER
jgi:ABC-type uncharacterized transport system substrate-binding protein